MKHKIIIPAALTGVFPLLTIAQSSDRPNIILIMADDMGYSDIGCYGGEIETPNIDRLANNGIRYTQFYNGARSCPTRASLMTGLYAHQAGMGWMTVANLGTPQYQGELNDKCLTIAEALKSAGYATFMSGKWHLTGYARAGATYESSPDKHGFDEVFTSENEGIANGTWFHPYHFNKDLKELSEEGREFLVDRMNEEAIRFIERQNKRSPFFLYLT